MQDGRLERLLDRTEIFDLVRLERHYRDVKNWDGLLGSFLSGAIVRTTWFEGTAAEFVDASRKKMSRTGAIISSPKHWIMPTVLQLFSVLPICLPRAAHGGGLAAGVFRGDLSARSYQGGQSRGNASRRLGSHQDLAAVLQIPGLYPIASRLCG